jgi:hypothetical protein
MLGKEQCLKQECKHNHTFKYGQIYASSGDHHAWCKLVHLVGKGCGFPPFIYQGA